MSWSWCGGTWSSNAKGAGGVCTGQGRFAAAPVGGKNRPGRLFARGRVPFLPKSGEGKPVVILGQTGRAKAWRGGTFFHSQCHTVGTVTNFPLVERLGAV